MPTYAKSTEVASDRSRAEIERTLEPTPTLALRFWRLVAKGPGPNDCWMWIGYKDRKGYGVINFDGKRPVRAHRAAWFLETGELPEMVLHRCDNPSCVRFSHLFAGDHSANMADMARKGRAAGARTGRASKDKQRHGDQHWTHRRPQDRLCGEANGNAVLTWDLVRSMRRRRAEGALVREIAVEFGISRGHASQVLSGAIWKDVRQ